MDKTMNTPDDMERVVESGKSFYTGPGFKSSGSTPKTKDGDQSVAMAGALGTAGETWQSLLNDGCENPYPITTEALKIKNGRKNNDSFTG
jgi:hypothetical protein